MNKSKLNKQSLTPRQKQLLKFIIQQIQEYHLPPSYSEMVHFLHASSKNTVAKILRSLEQKGYIETTSKARGIIVLQTLSDTLDRGSIRAPVVGNIQAGNPQYAEEHIEDWVNLPHKLTKGHKDVFLLKVKGDSMIGAGILENDLVIVMPTKEARNNDIVVALFQNEATVKRLIKIKNRVYLKPENLKYENIYPEEDWVIQGKVVGVIRQMM